MKDLTIKLIGKEGNKGLNNGCLAWFDTFMQWNGFWIVWCILQKVAWNDCTPRDTLNKEYNGNSKNKAEANVVKSNGYLLYNFCFNDALKNLLTVKTLNPYRQEIEISQHSK